jgi:hypothetical protein
LLKSKQVKQVNMKRRGRPAKVKDPVVDPKDQMITDLEEIVTKLTKELERKQFAYDDLNRENRVNMHRIKYHCEQVFIHTGNIDLSDVTYSINLADRIIDAKFNTPE